MLVVLLYGCGDALRKDLLRFPRAGLAGEKLPVHQISGNVIRMVFKKRAEVLVGGNGIAAVHAFHGQAIAREGVVWFVCHELFQRLSAGFLLSSHKTSRIIRVAAATSNITPEQEDGMKRKNRSNTEPETELPGKPVNASRSEMTEIVLPAQTNPLGKLLGGQVMHLVDMAAALAAHRHSNSYVVTASVDYIDFRNPVNLGEIVNLKSQVNRVFRTSMEVGVEVYSENAMTGERKHTTTAYVTFVAVDEHTRKPKPVPPLILRTPEERRRFNDAAERRETRLALRYGADSGRAK
jgi:acyl-CoA hydrolase